MDWKITSFIITHILLGRKVSIAYGAGIGLNPGLTILLALPFEIIQIPIFFLIYHIASKKIPFFKRWKKRLDEKHFKSSLFQKLRKHGGWGVFLLSLYPFIGGGVFTSSLLAYILKMKKSTTYFIIILGTVISLLALAGLFSWVFTLF